MDGCRERIQLMYVDEKKREEVNSANGPGTMALPFFCKLDETGRDRLPNQDENTRLISEKQHHRWQELMRLFFREIRATISVQRHRCH